MANQFQPFEENIDADDYRAFFDTHILRVWHLQGKERVYRITRVTALTSEMVNDKGVRKVQRQPKLLLETQKGKALPLPLLLNKTNAKAIAQMYGKRPADWVGKLISLYPGTTDAFGETVDCIRIRNQIPGSQPSTVNRQGVNVLPPRSEPPPSAPALTDHDKATKNEEDDDEQV
jgi:hypothetical protein